MDSLIREKILQSIISGTYRWGEKLPSENQLAEDFSVPRITVRKALLTLEEMGYVYSKQGKGRYIRKKQAHIPLNLTGEESFTQKLQKAGFHLKTSTLSYKQIEWNDRIATRLEGNKGDVFYRVERLRIIDGKTVAIHISYLKESIFPDISVQGDSIESLYDYFQDHGYSAFKTGKSVMSITLPTIEEQNILGCPPLMPLVSLESNTLDAISGIVLQYTRILYRSDAFQYELD